MRGKEESADLCGDRCRRFDGGGGLPIASDTWLVQPLDTSGVESFGKTDSVLCIEELIPFQP